MTAAVAAVTVAVGCSAVRAVLRLGARRAAGLVGPAWHPRLPPPDWLRRALDDAAVPGDPALVWSGALGVAVAAGVVALVAGGPGLASATSLLLLGGPLLALGARRGRSARLVDEALPEALDAVARALRSGAAVPQALAEVAPTVPGRLGDDLRALVRRAEAGAPFLAGLGDWPARCPTPGVRLAAAAMALAADSGGAAAAAIDGVAATLRAELAIAGEVRAQSSQARLSALVIALAPLVFGALAAGTDGRTAHFLLRTPLGSLCLVGGLALDAAAAWWMQRITATPW